MDEVEVVSTSADENYRVVLVRDQYAEVPDWDGQAYVFDVSYYGRYTVDLIQESVDPGDPYAIEVDVAVERAIRWWGTDWDLVERYLRIFHDVVKVERYDRTGGGTLLAVVTAVLAERWRCSVELIQEQDHLKEWRAWDEGDVYGYEIQQRVRWTTDADFEDREEWEHVDSCWGYYGSEWAEDAASEALALYLSVRGAA